MALNDANIKAVITAEDKASAVLDNFGNNTGSVAGKIGSLLKTTAEGALVLGGAIADVLTVSTKAYSEQQNAIAQINAGLKSTHDASGLNVQDLTEQANALQKVTTYSHVQVEQTEALLLSFENIHGAVYQQALPAILDVATGMKEDLQTATIQVGKALQDPITGLTSLRRIGVGFSKDQKEQIKNFVETNQVAKAQAIILAELNTEFGGRASAAASTFSGSLQQIKNSLKDAEEAIGKIVVEKLQPFAAAAAHALASIDWTAVISKVVNGLTGFIKVLEDVTKSLVNIFQQIEKFLMPKFEALANSITNYLMPALRRLWQDGLEPVIVKLGSSVGAGLVGAVGLVVSALNVLVRALSFVIQHMDTFLPIITALGTAFIVLKAKMALDATINTIIIGFNTLRLITIPSLLASLAGLAAFFTTPWGAALGAAMLAVAALTSGFINNKTHADDLRGANDKLKQSYKDLQDAQDNLKNAQLGLEGAQLNVQAAQQNYNDTVARFGADSLPAKQALHDLHQAQFDLDQAQKNSIKSLQNLKDKQDEVSKDKSLVGHLQDLQGNLDAVGNKAFNAGQQIQTLNGSKVTIKTSQGTGGQQVIDFKSTFGGGRAKGGAVEPGTPYVVGEQGEEVFVPDQAGTIVPHHKIASASAGQPQGNVTMNITIQAGAFMGSAQDARKYAQSILQAMQDLATSNGMSFDQLWRHHGVRSI